MSFLNIHTISKCGGHISTPINEDTTSTFTINGIPELRNSLNILHNPRNPIKSRYPRSPLASSSILFPSSYLSYSRSLDSTAPPPPPTAPCYLRDICDPLEPFSYCCPYDLAGFPLLPASHINSPFEMHMNVGLMEHGPQNTRF